MSCSWESRWAALESRVTGHLADEPDEELDVEEQAALTALFDTP